MVLSSSDIRVDCQHNPTYLSVSLCGSKTDPFGESCTLYIGRTISRICPVTAILAYLAIRSSATGPLFLHADGTPLTRPELISAVHLALTTTGMDLSRYTGQSFRIGAATSAALAGLLDSLIQALEVVIFLKIHQDSYPYPTRSVTATSSNHLDVTATLSLAMLFS